MPFIHDDFLLFSAKARSLYHTYAANEPILDYHCHLPPGDIAANRQFANLFEIWLEGDHYKWRAMRANGISEPFCTGNAAPFEKFLAYARTVPQTLRNPLYHWTHLELARYFGITDLVDESSARQIWDRANAQLPSLRVWDIFPKFQVKAVCTTDDPTDTLAEHQALAASGCPAKVFPAFRPDKALNTQQPAAWNMWVDRLSAVSEITIDSYQHLLDALKQRHDFFHSLGARLSDHGLSHAYADFISESEASAIFHKVRSGEAATPTEHAQFASNLMLYFGHLDAQKNWTKQLHLGALRGVNSRKLAELGPDTGFDSMGDWPQTAALGRYLDRLEQENALPKTILYNNNPIDNYALATMIGNFQDGSIAGKMQFGSGWWFLDQKEGIELQLNALSNVGLLSRFVGMLTDSRSFLSYPRHEYFRRVLCNLLGAEMERGELPDDEQLVGAMVRNICYQNANQLFGLAV